MSGTSNNSSFRCYNGCMSQRPRKPCESCGDSATGRRCRACYIGEATTHRWQSCKGCGKHGRWTPSGRCRSCYGLDKRNERERIVRGRPCDDCGAPCRGKWCRLCWKLHAGESRGVDGAVGRASQQRRRARLAEVMSGPIDFNAVIARTDGRCGICGRRVGPTQISFDHIIPLAAAGPHIESNLQLAHLRCNAKRGHRRPAQTRLTL